MTILANIKKEIGSKETSIRLKNNQISIFNSFINSNCISFKEAGQFICENISLFKPFQFLSIEEIFSIKSFKVQKAIKNLAFIKISKKQMFIAVLN